MKTYRPSSVVLSLLAILFLGSVPTYADPIMASISLSAPSPQGVTAATAHFDPSIVPSNPGEREYAFFIELVIASPLSVNEGFMFSNTLPYPFAYYTYENDGPLTSNTQRNLAGFHTFVNPEHWDNIANNVDWTIFLASIVKGTSDPLVYVPGYEISTTPLDIVSFTVWIDRTEPATSVSDASSLTLLGIGLVSLLRHRAAGTILVNR